METVSDELKESLGGMPNGVLSIVLEYISVCQECDALNSDVEVCEHCNVLMCSTHIRKIQLDINDQSPEVYNACEFCKVEHNL
jgi:hypothetical protein